MLFNPKHEDRLGRLEHELQLAQDVTPDLISNVIAEAGVRSAGLDHAEKAARMNRLIEAGAWTEVALALIELELPAWTLRRLVYEDGDWLCSLSREPNLPVTLDQAADGSHDVSPLAILTAFVAARRMTSAAR